MDDTGNEMQTPFAIAKGQKKPENLKVLIEHVKRRLANPKDQQSNRVIMTTILFGHSWLACTWLLLPCLQG
jgi:hypothetical protein